MPSDEQSIRRGTEKAENPQKSKLQEEEHRTE